MPLHPEHVTDARATTGDLCKALTGPHDKFFPGRLNNMYLILCMFQNGSLAEPLPQTRVINPTSHQEALHVLISASFVACYPEHAEVTAAVDHVVPVMRLLHDTPMLETEDVTRLIGFFKHLEDACQQATALLAA